MKQISVKVLFAAIAALCVVACAEELVEENVLTQEGTVVYTASVDGAETRTVLEGNLSKWSGDEKIQIVGEKGSYVFEATLDSPSEKADFTYSGEYEETEVMAVYPAGDTDYSVDLGSLMVSGVTLPSEQVAVAGSYDPDAAVAVAHTTDMSLSFKNVVSLVKFTVVGDGVKNITFTGYDSSKKAVNVAGDIDIAYNDGEPVATGASASSVVLSAADGAAFENGETYYIAVLPGTFEGGISISADGVNVKSTTKDITFKRSTIYNLGDIVCTKQTGVFTVPAVPQADEPCKIYYRAASGDELYGAAGDLYAHIGLYSGTDWYNVISEWGVNTSKFKFKKEATNLWSLTLEPTIREWFGLADDQYLGCLGLVVRNSAGTKQTRPDIFIPVEDEKNKGNVMPAGIEHGINYNSDGTVTLVLYDRDKNGDSHSFCYFLSDLSGWKRTDDYKMKYDASSGCWWITLTGLDPDKEYKFQYSLGYEESDDLRIFDPYTEIVYDTWNDKDISSSTYPGLQAGYYDGQWGNLSAFQINRPEYDWEVDGFAIEDKEDLVIYEMLLRDFSASGDINGAIDELDYIEGLGVNAVELMPVQEFDNNDSWGYNPCAYFALDKAYGTRDDYKLFIDECHKRGIAVILDVAYNHATGSHPMAALYWDSANNKTASNNPWFNVDAPHGFSVYHDWNHSNPMVRDHIKRSLEYLLTEYKVDGFRFDLSRGFTQYDGVSYTSERVGYLKEYHYHIQCVNPDAVMICEHFVDDENYDLGNDGMMVWRNMNYSYSESHMGWMDNADFTGLTNTYNSSTGALNDYIAFGTYVGYMESHDEERTTYKAKEYGTDSAKGTVAMRMKRAGLNAAFFLLVPGPKMIWQFGEIGYDYSINYNGDRTAAKPVVTDAYLKTSSRKGLYDTYAMLLGFRRDNSGFFDSDAKFRWYVDGSHKVGRYMFGEDAEGNRFAVFGNFGTGSQTISVTLPTGGKWYQYDTGAVWEGSTHNPTMDEGQFYILVDDKSLCLK